MPSRKKMKGHATPYGILAYTTQYLKVKYPLEFFCAHLEQAADDEYAQIKSVASNNYGVKFTMPHINISKDKFVIHDESIAWSLTSIKGLGHKAAQEIIGKQPFSSFEQILNSALK
jgi:DNA polymerase-3 subunit alpha